MACRFVCARFGKRSVVRRTRCVEGERAHDVTPRCARGKITVKVVPSPTLLSARIVPPSAVTMPWQMDSPRPVPTPTGLVVKNGWNNRRMCSGAIPAPVSRIATQTFSPSA
jgi:hypothetical protein